MSNGVTSRKLFSVAALATGDTTCIPMIPWPRHTVHEEDIEQTPQFLPLMKHIKPGAVITQQHVCSDPSQKTWHDHEPGELFSALSRFLQDKTACKHRGGHKKNEPGLHRQGHSSKTFPPHTQACKHKCRHIISSFRAAKTAGPPREEAGWVAGRNFPHTGSDGKISKRWHRDNWEHLIIPVNQLNRPAGNF